MNFIKIEEGLNLNIIKTKKFKTTCLAILLKQKLDRNKTTLNALLPKILLNGTKNYKTIRDINIKMEEIGINNFYSDIIKKGDNQVIEFLIEFSWNEENLDKVFKFLSEIILNPLTENGVFKKEYFEISKNLLTDEIKSRENDKKSFAKDRCVEEMFKNEPFGIFAGGYLEDFDKLNINEKTLYEHYKKVLQESEINIICVGDLEDDLVKNLFEKNFKLEQRKFNKFETDFNKIDKKEPKFIEEAFNVTQGKLCMGFRTGVSVSNELFLPLLVGNEILGGGSSSKLFNNVREKKSLCYYINSFLFIFKGVIFIQSGVDFNRYKDVVDYIQKEVANIKKGDFLEEDIKDAVNSLEKKYMSIYDYNTSIMDFYFTNFLANINLDLKEMTKRIKEVKKQDIVKAFENIWLDTCYFMKGDEN